MTQSERKLYAEKLTYSSLNKIYQNGSDEYKSKIGQYEMGDSLRAYGEPIIAYSSTMNEFINSLVQLVAFPIFQSHMWDNRLKALKKGTKPFGFDIEDIYTNPVMPTAYKADDFSRILKGTKQDTITAFYRENRKDVFQKTITKDMLRGAFADAMAFNEFIDTLIKTIYSGNEIAEYNLVKKSLNECLAAGMFVTDTIDVTTSAGIQDGIEKIKNCYELFQFPSSAYNNYATYSGTGKTATVWTRPEDIVVLANVKTMNAMKVKYLAGVFNLSEVEFRDRLILVDSFDYDEYETDTDGVTGKLKAHKKSAIDMVVCDAGLFQIYDTLETSVDTFNAGNLAWNYFLHIWQTYGIRPWANAVVFLEGNGIATDVDPATAELTEVGASEEFEFTDATGETVTTSASNVDMIGYEGDSIVDITGLFTVTYGDTLKLEVASGEVITNGTVLVKCGNAQAVVQIHIA